MNQAEADYYNRKQIREVIKVFKVMDEVATQQAKKVSGDLADYALGKIKAAAGTRTISTRIAEKVASGGKVSKSSKIGELSLGFASQKFSGGASTKTLWGPMEFGSNKLKQFPNRTPRVAPKGNAGYFIYPTLRAIQPHIISEWQTAFSKIIKEFNDGI